ncbi:S1 RNA-binding domain-containing protein [Spirochaetota bacterium]
MDSVIEEHNESIDMEHIAESVLDSIQPGMIIHGEIVTIDEEYAYVNVGTKSDGRISLGEFKEKPEVGKEIDVMLQDKRLVDGVYQFSKVAADIERNWKEFISWYNEGNDVITGTIKNAVSKGKLINCKDIIAFLPFSLAADMKGESTSEQKYELKIKSIDEKKRSVILSRKDFLDEDYKIRWEKFAEKYNVGDRLDGEVIKFVEFGAFVHIGGVDALLHRNDISWRNVFKQRKILKLGQVREFIILNINNDSRKVSIGLKQLTDDPWLKINEKFNEDDEVPGKVVTITNMGAFIEIDDDIEGFVNNTDLSWTRNNVSARDLLTKGQESKFRILEINKEERRLLLGLKQTMGNPWETIDERFPVGTILKKKIDKIVKFGMFVEIEENIDGLIHISDISWEENIKNLSSSYNEGDEVEFKILEIKKDEKKIACGIKQLTKSPWEHISEKYKPRTTVKGAISGITQFGVFVKLEENVEGLVHISEISKDRIENLDDHFKVGDKVNAVVLFVDISKKRLALSIKHYDMVSEKEELKRILNETSPNKVTLGDMINLKLDN